MRQVGVVAAAGHYALDNNISRLAEDHKRAEYFANELREMNIGNVDSGTNMVFFTPTDGQTEKLRSHLENIVLKLVTKTRQYEWFYTVIFQMKTLRRLSRALRPSINKILLLSFMVRRGQRNRIRWENIESPCVKICKLENGVCIGCGRTQDEIREWVIMTNSQREEIMERLKTNSSNE